MRTILVISVLGVLAACGSKSPAPAEPGAVATTPDVPFDKLDHKQKIEFMKQKVVPTMKPLYQNHDATKFAEFSCETCHGKGAKEGHFDMPNAELPKLNFADMSKFKKEDIEWMEKDIKPTMAKLLQMPEYTEQNPKGFGCLACHTQEGSS